MTKDELLERLSKERSTFDAKVTDVARCALDVPVAGSSHTVKDIVAHVNAYEDLIVQRLQAARHGETTALDRDREGWQVFNDRMWVEVGPLDTNTVFARSADIFSALLDEIGGLTDEELNERTGVTQSIDPAWLGERTLGAMIEMDATEHYSMHYAALDAAAQAGSD